MDTQRIEAENRYYANPKLCQTCGAVIKIRGNEAPNVTRKKMFCNHSCSAKSSNCGRKRIRACRGCSAEISVGRFCAPCIALLPNSRGSQLPSSTKGELFARRVSWISARQAIRKHAVLVYATSGRPAACQCGYDRHYNICHIKPISDFPDTATIAEMNAIENLIALCPNCHWEFDNGLLSRRDGAKAAHHAHDVESDWVRFPTLQPV
jgi:5-methylcytosine-specific restriction endonuclease McrA